MTSSLVYGFLTVICQLRNPLCLKPLFLLSASNQYHLMAINHSLNPLKTLKSSILLTSSVRCEKKIELVSKYC